MKKSAISKSDVSDATTFNQYDNSRPIDVHWVSDYPEVQAVTNQITQEVVELIDYKKIKKDYLDQIRKHVQLVILDVYVAYVADPTMYIAYSRSKRNYHEKSRYKKLYISYEFLIKKTIDSLIKLNYLEGINGFIDRKRGKGYQARIRATSKLLSVLKKNKVASIQIIRNNLEEVIRLKSEKDQEGKTELIDYEDTAETIQMRENLNKINDWLTNTFIDLYITDAQFKKLQKRLADSIDRSPINFCDKQLHRVFNNCSFEQGGRFYGGWWQNIPKEYRHFINIGGGENGAFPKYSVEYDYNAQHIRMLYADVGIDYGPQDPFDIGNGNEQIRHLLKRSFYTIVNCKDEAQAIKAVEYQLKGGKKRYGKHMIQRNQADLPAGITSAADIVKLLRDKHKPIEDYLHSGQGLYLQRRDSDIAEKVMLEMKRYRARALPVHDSFLVNISYDCDVADVMERIFSEEIGVHCPAIIKIIDDEHKYSIQPKQLEDCVFSLKDKESEQKMKQQDKKYSLYNSRLRTFQESIKTII